MISINSFATIRVLISELLIRYTSSLATDLKLRGHKPGRPLKGEGLKILGAVIGQDAHMIAFLYAHI